MTQKPTTKPTLIAVAIAAGWILLLHASIVIWTMFEPARIDEVVDKRLESRRAVAETEAKPVPPETKATDASGQGDLAPKNNAGNATEATSHVSRALPMPPQLSVLGWGHVAFPTILLASCVAIFASLVWAAVALNRDYD